MHKSTTTSVRLDPNRYAKLEQLAARTRRSKGAVLRMLLDQARLASVPDIELVAGGAGKDGRDEKRT